MRNLSGVKVSDLSLEPMGASDSILRSAEAQTIGSLQNTATWGPLFFEALLGKPGLQNDALHPHLYERGDPHVESRSPNSGRDKSQAHGFKCDGYIYSGHQSYQRAGCGCAAKAEEHRRSSHLRNSPFNPTCWTSSRRPPHPHCPKSSNPVKSSPRHTKPKHLLPAKAPSKTPLSAFLTVPEIATTSAPRKPRWWSTTTTAPLPVSAPRGSESASCRPTPVPLPSPSSSLPQSWK